MPRKRSHSRRGMAVHLAIVAVLIVGAFVVLFLADAGHVAFVPWGALAAAVGLGGAFSAMMRVFAQIAYDADAES